MGYQDFHQRTLSSSSPRTAQLTCFIAAPLFIVFAIPSMLIGAVAVSTGDVITLKSGTTLGVYQDLVLIFNVKIIRLEHDRLRISLTIPVRRGKPGSSHCSATPHSTLHLSHWHWSYCCCGDVVHRLSFVIRSICVHHQHL